MEIICKREIDNEVNKKFINLKNNVKVDIYFIASFQISYLILDYETNNNLNTKFKKGYFKSSYNFAEIFHGKIPTSSDGFYNTQDILDYLNDDNYKYFKKNNIMQRVNYDILVNAYNVLTMNYSNENIKDIIVNQFRENENGKLTEYTDCYTFDNFRLKIISIMQ